MLNLNNNFLECQISQKKKEQEGLKYKRLISKENLNESVSILNIHY